MPTHMRYARGQTTVTLLTRNEVSRTLESRPAVNIELANMIPSDTRCTGIVHLDRVEISAELSSWEFAAVRRAKINKHFSRLQKKRSALWNGACCSFGAIWSTTASSRVPVLKPIMRASSPGAIRTFLTERSTILSQLQYWRLPMDPI